MCLGLLIFIIIEQDNCFAYRQGNSHEQIAPTTDENLGKGSHIFELFESSILIRAFSAAHENDHDPKTYFLQVLPKFPFYEAWVANLLLYVFLLKLCDNVHM